MKNRKMLKNNILPAAAAAVILALPSSTWAQTSSEESAFYQALSSISIQDATYQFMLAQLLEQRCGKSQFKHLGDLQDTQLAIIRSLKIGDVVTAKDILAKLPCGR